MSKFEEIENFIEKLLIVGFIFGLAIAGVYFGVIATRDNIYEQEVPQEHSAPRTIS